MPLPVPVSPRIRRLSAILSVCCLALAVLLPLAVIGYWATVPSFAAAFRSAAPTAAALPPLELWQRGLGALLAAAPALLMALGLLRIRACFAAFAAGRYFSAEAVGGLRGFARAAFASVIAGLVLTPVASVALSLGLPPGQRHLVVGVDSHQLLGLVMAGLVWVVAAGLAEGMALAEENAQFV